MNIELKLNFKWSEVKRLNLQIDEIIKEIKAEGPLNPEQEEKIREMMEDPRKVFTSYQRLNWSEVNKFYFELFELGKLTERQEEILNDAISEINVVFQDYGEEDRYYTIRTLNNALKSPYVGGVIDNAYGTMRKISDNIYISGEAKDKILSAQDPEDLEEIIEGINTGFDDKIERYMDEFREEVEDSGLVGDY